jgi:ATP-binding cassette subfamily C exporter for protease/lipase
MAGYSRRRFSARTISLPAQTSTNFSTTRIRMSESRLLNLLHHRSSSAISPIMAALSHYRAAFISIGCFSAIINILLLAPSMYMLQVYDRVLASKNEMTLFMLTAMVLGVLGVLSFLDYIRNIIAVRIGYQLEQNLDRHVYTGTYQANLNGSNLLAVNTLGDLSTVRQFMSGPGFLGFFDAPWFPIYLVVIFLFNVWLGVLAVIGSATLLTIAVVTERISSNAARETATLSIRANATATSHLRNTDVVEAMGMMPALFHKWQHLYAHLLQQQCCAAERTVRLNSAARFFRMAFQSIVLGTGALLAIAEQITPGMMIAASILMGRVLAPLEQMIGGWKQFTSAQTAWRRLDAIIIGVADETDRMSLPRPTGHVSVESVSVCALSTTEGSEARMVFSSLSCQLAPGDVMGVIGASGSGKSTLASLLVGARKPAAGKIRLDGADIHQWDKSELGHSLGYLPQDVGLLSGTLRENIARFQTTDPAEVIRAAQLANVHDMILQMPMGYDTVLGDGGIGLSGGQRQRIGLARAVYGQPALVVLDEPNAHLDAAGELALGQTVRHLAANGVTVVLVTHRSSLLDLTNKLLCLRHAQAALFGPTATVLSALANNTKNLKAVAS